MAPGILSPRPAAPRDPYAWLPRGPPPGAPDPPKRPSGHHVIDPYAAVPPQRPQGRLRLQGDAAQEQRHKHSKHTRIRQEPSVTGHCDEAPHAKRRKHVAEKDTTRRSP